MGPCCVDGCTDVKEDTVYFEFPTSRGLRRKWLEMIKIPHKVPLGTVVCSQHFNPHDYEVVRGKVRLKRKVVPTLKLYQTLSKQASPSPEIKKPVTPDPIETKLPESKLVENVEILPQPDSTTGNIESNIRSPEREERESEEICKVVNKDDECVNDRLLPLPDQTPDFEDMITNYQIKTKPNLLHSEVEVTEETIEVDGKDDAPPVFIEISVDKDTSTATSSQDCLMVLESVQVEVDPATLLLETYEEIDQEVKEDTQKKDDPISLLTSSDEDDVIIQEPHIDTVEVSDETDEDDVPLVKFLKKKTSKKKVSKKVKKVSDLPVNSEALRQLVWTGVYGFYCIQCQFRTLDSSEYTKHLKDHQKVLQVCHICNYTSASKTQFSRHSRKHKEEKKFKCHQCEYRARHKMSLIYHMQCHEKDKDKIQSVKTGFKCKKCGFKSNMQGVVLKHVRLCENGVKMFSCHVCNYSTKRKSDLRRHISCRHKGETIDCESDSNN